MLAELWRNSLERIVPRSSGLHAQNAMHRHGRRNARADACSRGPPRKYCLRGRRAAAHNASTVTRAGPDSPSSLRPRRARSSLLIRSRLTATARRFPPRRWRRKEAIGESEAAAGVSCAPAPDSIPLRCCLLAREDLHENGARGAPLHRSMCWIGRSLVAFDGLQPEMAGCSTPGPRVGLDEEGVVDSLGCESPSRKSTAAEGSRHTALGPPSSLQGE